MILAGTTAQDSLWGSQPMGLSGIKKWKKWRWERSEDTVLGSFFNKEMTDETTLLLGCSDSSANSWYLSWLYAVWQPCLQWLSGKLHQVAVNRRASYEWQLIARCRDVSTFKYLYCGPRLNIQQRMQTTGKTIELSGRDTPLYEPHHLSHQA